MVGAPSCGSSEAVPCSTHNMGPILLLAFHGLYLDKHLQYSRLCGVLKRGQPFIQAVASTDQWMDIYMFLA